MGLPSRIRVVLFASSMEGGGTEQLLLKLASGLDRDRFDLYLATFVERGPWVERLRALPWPRLEFPLRGKLFNLHGIRSNLRLVRWLRRKEIHILHTLQMEANLWGGLAAGLARTPVALASRLNRADWMSPAKRRLKNWLCRHVFHRVIVNGESLKREFVEEEGLPGEKLVVIPNGIDLTPYQPGASREAVRRHLLLPPSSRLVVTVANFVPAKGYEHVIEAVARVLARRQCHEPHFLFLGEGPLLEAMRQRAKRLNIDGRVHFLGWQRDVPWWLNGVDAFLLGSVTEGLPNATIEAMAAGLPIICTDVGAIGDVVTDGINGWLATPGDDESLATAIERFLESPDRGATMGGRNRQTALQEFHVERLVADHARLYEAMYAQSRLRR